MKKTITTILMLPLALIAISADASELLLSSRNHESIVVMLDNVPFHRPVVLQRIDDIAPGNHSLKVSKVIARPHSRFPVKQVLYEGTIFIPPNTLVTARVERNFNLSILAMEPIASIGCLETDCEDNCFPIPAHHSRIPVAMDHISFEQLKRSIESRTFESTKLQIARQAITANYFTTRQVAELLSQFTFESSKLEFAKFAYNRTLDKQSYFLVNDAFTFESSIDELNDYINRS